MVYKFVKQTVAVIGATGQVGTPLTKGLLDLGHEVWILQRTSSKSDTSSLEEGGAKIVRVDDMTNVDQVVNALRGADVLVSAIPASKESVTITEPIWLEAAVKAGVKRFVPTEFGCHTRSLEFGDGVLFDYKKQLHDKIFDSGIGWTFVYTGGIFDYFLPNLRFFEKITTFGNLDLPIYTHEIEDIGKIAAFAVTDERCLNKCVQLDFNHLTHTDMLDQIKANFPDYAFEFEHFSTEFITEAKSIVSDSVSAKKGSETDQERWGINYVIYVLGKLHGFTDETLRASALYPSYKVTKKPEEALKDPRFVFESA